VAEASFQWNVLTCLYGVALLGGLLYAFLLLFSQGIGHTLDIGIDLGHFDLGFHGGLGHDGGEVTGLSLLAVVGFVTAFGAFGLGSIALFSAGTLASLLCALLGGGLVGGAGQVFFVRVISPTISSNIDWGNIKGIPAEVIVSIPSDGLGQVAFVAEGQRHTLSARASNGVAIGRNVPVIIDTVRSGVAYVSEVPAAAEHTAGFRLQG